jgi:hypothetical protein
MRTEEWKRISLDLGKEAACVFYYYSMVNMSANNFDD